MLEYVRLDSRWGTCLWGGCPNSFAVIGGSEQLGMQRWGDSWAPHEEHKGLYTVQPSIPPAAALIWALEESPIISWCLESTQEPCGGLPDQSGHSVHFFPHKHDSNIRDSITFTVASLIQWVLILTLKPLCSAHSGSYHAWSTRSAKNTLSWDVSARIRTILWLCPQISYFI